MKLTYRFKDYDKSKQLTPSFGIVVGWNSGLPPALRFGAPIQGDPRVLTLDAEIGDVVVWEHKARRRSSARNPRPDAPKPTPSIRGFGVVVGDGTIREVTEPEARVAFTARRAPAKIPAPAGVGLPSR